jgi:hypothetical protein
LLFSSERRHLKPRGDYWTRRFRRGARAPQTLGSVRSNVNAAQEEGPKRRGNSHDSLGRKLGLSAAAGSTTTSSHWRISRVTGARYGHLLTGHLNQTTCPKFKPQTVASVCHAQTKTLVPQLFGLVALPRLENVALPFKTGCSTQHNSICPCSFEPRKFSSKPGASL